MEDAKRDADELLRELAELQRRLQALEGSEALLKATIDSIPFDFFVIGPDGRYIMQNSACREHGGDVIGKRPEDIATDADTRALWLGNNEKAFSGEVVSEEVCFSVGGVERRYHNIVSPIFRDGVVDSILGVNIDITERTRAVAALKRERDFADALLNAPTDTVFLFDLETGRPVRWNSNFAEISGYSDEEISRMKAPDDFYGAEDLERAAVAMSSALDSGHVRIEMDLVTGSGETVPFEYSGTVIEDTDGRKLLLAIGRDVSERKKAESERAQMQEQLLHKRKMEALGTLAGGIAHDFNNLLTVILGLSSLLKDGKGPGDSDYESLDIIEQSATRAAELTRQVLGFARKGKLTDAPVDVHRVLHNVVAIVQHTIDKSIVIAQRLVDEDVVTRGDAGQLEQVLMNVAINARDAMPDGGRLEFETSVVELGGDYCAQHPDLSPGEYVKISVSDNGIGMSHDVMSKAFDPFYTTKEVGKGTGMGLAMAYGALKNHSGHITVDSEPGKGTTFRLYLPRCVERLPQDCGTTESRREQAGARVLVVDDEELVQRAATTMLKSLGCEVYCVNNGREAIEYYGRHRNAIDLVLLDLTMPVMGGRECFIALRALDPEVKVAIATGHLADPSHQRLIDSGVIRFVQKPFRAGELADILASVLTL